jgi:hypothetical protein
MKLAAEVLKVKRLRYRTQQEVNSGGCSAVIKIMKQVFFCIYNGNSLPKHFRMPKLKIHCDQILRDVSTQFDVRRATKRGKIKKYPAKRTDAWWFRTPTSNR